MSSIETEKIESDAKNEPSQSERTATEALCLEDNNSLGQNSSTTTTISAITESQNPLRIPIVGYEVMEERAKFTVFKLRVESGQSSDCWFVFRRYTDFVRLHSRLKLEYVDINLPLPKKKWFGDNFNMNFISERIGGLQELVNEILNYPQLLSDSFVRDFFCLDEPPSVSDSVEESKAVVEALEDRIYQLQRQLKEKEVAYDRLKAAHSVEISAKLRLAGFVQECTKQCPSCAARLSQLSQISNP